MPSSVPAAKDGIRTYLATWPGLREIDGVTVRSAGGIDLPDDTVVLGEATAPQTFEGLVGKSETPTMTCWCQSTKTGTDEAAISLARATAYGLLALVEQALKADPDANATVPPPGRLSVGDSTLVEDPADVGAQGARRARVLFTIQWTAHIT